MDKYPWHDRSISVGSRVFVSRYKFSHDGLRRKYKRRLKEGKVRLVEQTKDGWCYEWVATP